MNTQPHPENDLCGAYVLDALEVAELLAFEEHLKTCAICRAEVAELRQVVDVLPLAVPLVQPPPSLRDRILAEVEAEVPAPARLTALPGGMPSTRENDNRRPRSWLRRPQTFLGVAAAVLLAAMGAWNVQLQHRTDEQKQTIAFQQVVERSIASGATVSQLPGTGSGSGAHAAMVQPPGGKAGYLIVDGLAPAPADKVYQLWFVKGTTPRSVKVFGVTGNGPQVVPMPMPATGYPVAAVTIEPGPRGSRLPTGPKVLLGKLSA